MVDRKLNCTENEWEKWLSTRPEHVQRLARRFPPNGSLETCKGRCYIVGYGQTEDGDVAVLLVSGTDPEVDYDKAVATSQPICECCGPSERKDNPDG